jgi:hypothetical protein
MSGHGKGCPCYDCEPINAALPPVRSEPLLAALDILRRLVDGLSEQYDERECPNGQPACGMCRLVTEAKSFLSANSVNHVTSDAGIKPTQLTTVKIEAEKTDGGDSTGVRT